MKNLAAVSSDESKILILCTLEWLPTQFVLQCNQWFREALDFFFHYSILLEPNFGWVLSPFLCSFLFALHLYYSLDTGVDKKSNAVCLFANFCSTLVCGLK